MVLPVVLLILIILVAAIITGSLWQVLEIAAGVALGLFLFVSAIAVAAWWLIRRRMRQMHRDLDRYRRDRYV
jgi:membrane protein implicated in regulation of membrane protease activity